MRHGFFADGHLIVRGLAGFRRSARITFPSCEKTLSDYIAVNVRPGLEGQIALGHDRVRGEISVGTTIVAFHEVAADDGTPMTSWA